MIKKTVKRVRPEVPKLSWSLEKLTQWWANHAKAVTIDEWDEKKEVPTLGDASYFAQDIIEFPNCCAFDVPNGLSRTKVDYLGDWSRGMVLCEVAYQLKSKGVHCAPFFLFATSEEQVNEEKILADLGVEKLKTVTNSNSNNMVTLWLAPAR